MLPALFIFVLFRNPFGRRQTRLLTLASLKFDQVSSTVKRLHCGTTFESNRPVRETTWNFLRTLSPT